MTPPTDFDGRMRRMEELLAEAERGGGDVPIDLVRALVAAVLDVHQSGLSEILEVARARANADASELDRELAATPSIASLLLLHDLHPDRTLNEEPAPRPLPVIPASRLAAGAEGRRP